MIYFYDIAIDSWAFYYLTDLYIYFPSFYLDLVLNSYIFLILGWLINGGSEWTLRLVLILHCWGAMIRWLFQANYEDNFDNKIISDKVLGYSFILKNIFETKKLFYI